MSAETDFEMDGTDILEGVKTAALYTHNGELYGLRIGGLTLDEAHVKRMLGPAHFARVQWLTTDELNAAQADWEDYMRELNEGA